MSIPRVLRVLCVPVLAALLALVAASTATAATAQQGAVRGGDVLYGGGARCTVGFNATDGSSYYGIMPSYCGDVGTQWYADPQHQVPVGVTETSHFPSGLYSVIRYTNPDLTYPSEINSFNGPLRIERAVAPVVGMQVCRYGPTTGWHCGVITRINVSVSLPSGVYNGLFSATICAEPGDMGGPAVSGNAAVGVLFGGSGDCTSGGETFYVPVVRVLQETGLTVGY